MANSFSEQYPHIATWVKEYGWIEMGFNEQNESFIRALDIGGMIWEGEYLYKSVDDGLQALESALAEWLKTQFGV